MLCIGRLNHHLSLQRTKQMRSTRKVLTLEKTKHRLIFARLKPQLFYLASLEQACTELVNEHVEACGVSGGSFFLYTKSGMALFYDVQKAIN